MTEKFTTHFIDIFVVETKRFVGSFVHVILTRQTCGQRLSKAAESKRRALGNFFPSEFAEKSDFSSVETRFFSGSRHCAAVLQTQVPKLCTDLDLGLLYILILGTYSKFARKNNFLSLGVCFLQLCSSAGRRFAASRSRLQNYRRIVLFPQQKFR